MMTAAVEFGARDDADGPLLAAAFQLLLTEGRPVTVDRLASALGRDAQTVTGVLGRLEQAGRIRNRAGAVTGSLGLSVEPTAHELLVEGARRWTWCAYDAVGILAALGASGQVRSRSPHTGAPIQFAVQQGRPVAGSSVVVFLAQGPCVSVVDDWCPLVNFFEDAQAAGAWAAQRGVTGTAVPLQQAAATGDAAWRSQLDRGAGQEGGGDAAACC
jgi:Alkylmercury lyase/DprA winged helix domain